MMKLVKSLLIVNTFILQMFILEVASADSQANDYLTSADLVRYYPQDSELKNIDVIFRMEGLETKLNQMGFLGKISDVKFHYKWISATEQHLDIIGLPHGFNEFKEQLKTSFKGMMVYMVPQKLSEELSAYNTQLKKSDEKGLQDMIEAVPIKGGPSIVLKFDSNYLLKKTIGMNALGSSEIEYTYEKTSTNKNYPIKVTEAVSTPNGKFFIRTYIKMGKKDSYYFPEKIEVVQSTMAGNQSTAIVIEKIEINKK